MTSENALWRKARNELAPWGCLIRVENPIDPGTPDAAYAMRVQGVAGSGWLELKELDRWPVRFATPVHLPKLTLEQVIFARTWTAAGGRCFGLVQVGRGYWLIDSATLTAVYDGVLTASGFRASAVAGDAGRFPLGDILRALVK